MSTCQTCGRPRLLDAFSGEGGAGVGYMRAGFCVDAVDRVPSRKTDRGRRARLNNYPFDCPAQQGFAVDAVQFILERGHEYAAGHGSPTCTGYSRGTAALPDRFERYDRLIPAVRDAFETAGIPYVIENVEDASPELRGPVLLCGRMFGLSATDTDGTPVVMDRHRLFESNIGLLVPEHLPHDRSLQVAGSYGGARRDKWEAKHVRGGGYVPAVEVQRELLGTPWMTERGCQLSIPPAYTEHIGRQLLAHVESEVVAWRNLRAPHADMWARAAITTEAQWDEGEEQRISQIAESADEDGRYRPLRPRRDR
jgi:DNA (cytosine-5)-methyltransferase 1